MKSKFSFYEKIIVRTDKPYLKDIDGQLGAILGIGEDEGNGFSYAVHIYQNDTCWSVIESDLETIGQFDTKDSFFEGYSIKVDSEGNGPIDEITH